MATTELRRRLDDELAGLAEPMRALRADMHDFWRHPETPELRVSANFPATAPAALPAAGSISEQALFEQLHNSVRPALESRTCGFDTVPTLAAHVRHYHGPAFGTRFLAAVLGAEIEFPAGLPAAERTGWRAAVKPLLIDLAELGRIEDTDVARSPVLRPILRAYRELAEIVRGRIPFTRYTPTLPLDLAADVVGHTRFFELVATDPAGVARLVDVCTEKWLDLVRLQNEAVNGTMVSYLYQPGIYVHDMILAWLAPQTVRDLVLPYNRRLATEFGGLALQINHPDEALLDDYLQLPNVHACGFKRDWTASRVMDRLQSRGVLTVNLNWHFHEDQQPWSPECLPWTEHCRRLQPYAGRLRVLATLAGWGETAADRRRCQVRDLADLRRIWQNPDAGPPAAAAGRVLANPAK